MCGDAGAKAANSMCAYGFANEFAISEAVKHGSVSAEISAPAHAHGGKDSNGVVVDNASGIEGGHQTNGGAYCSQCRDGETNQSAILKAEKPVEYEVDLVGKPCYDRYTFVGLAQILSIFAGRAKGEHHDNSAYAQYAGNDSNADTDTALSSVEHSVEETLEDATLAFERDVLLGAFVLSHRAVHFGIAFESEMLHETSGNDAPNYSAQQTYLCSATIALARHEGYDNKTHAEGCAEVC